MSDLTLERVKELRAMCVDDAGRSEVSDALDLLIRYMETAVPDCDEQGPGNMTVRCVLGRGHGGPHRARNETIWTTIGLPAALEDAQGLPTPNGVIEHVVASVLRRYDQGDNIGEPIADIIRARDAALVRNAHELEAAKGLPTIEVVRVPFGGGAQWEVRGLDREIAFTEDMGDPKQAEIDARDVVDAIRARDAAVAAYRPAAERGGVDELPTARLFTNAEECPHGFSLWWECETCRCTHDNCVEFMATARAAVAAKVREGAIRIVNELFEQAEDEQEPIGLEGLRFEIESRIRSLAQPKGAEDAKEGQR